MFFRTESVKDFIRFYPIVTTILAIKIIVWLFMFIPNPIGDLIYIYGVGWNTMIDAGQYWRFISSIFLHDPTGVRHVLFNSFSLILFGPALEQMLGKWKFSSIYLFSGIFANIFTHLLETTPNYMHLGASGAIYGLLGLYIYMAFFRQDLIDPASRQIIIVFSVIGLIMTFLQSGINQSAHLFGFIGGLALGPVALTRVRPFSPWRNRRPRRSREVGFNPNRWNKRRFPRFRVSKNVSAIIWWIILFLAILGILGPLFFRF